MQIYLRRNEACSRTFHSRLPSLAILHFTRQCRRSIHVEELNWSSIGNRVISVSSGKKIRYNNNGIILEKVAQNSFQCLDFDGSL